MATSTIFTTNSVDTMEAIVMSNGNLFLAYRDNTATDKGKITIYTKDGVEVLAPTTVDSGTNSYFSCSQLTNSNVVIAYYDFTDSDGKFVIHTQAGAEVVSPTEFESGRADYVSVAALNNGNFFVTYRDIDDSNKGKFTIFNSSGSVVKAATIFEADFTVDTKVILLNNTNVFVVYKNQTNNRGEFVIYDEDGTLVKAATIFETGGTAIYCKPVLLGNTNVFIPYRDTSNSSKGTFAIYDQAGTAVISPTVFSTANTTDIAAVKDATNTNVLISYKGTDGDGFYVVYTQAGVEVTSEIEFETSSCDNNSMAAFSDGKIAITYYNGTDGILYIFNPLYQPTSGPDITSVKKLVAAGNNELWYESSAGTMTELSAANGDIDTTDQLAMFEGYQKVFVVNGANLKVADFINTKLSTADARPNDGTNVAPIKGTILTGGTSGAKMVTDFCNAFNGAALIYGYVISGTFQNGEVVTGTNASGTPTAVSFTTDAAPGAAPHWYNWIAYPTVGGKSFGSLPNKAYIGCLYRGRCVLSGNPEFPFQWYMSRQTNPWDFAYVANDAGSPVKGGNSDAGEIGDIVRALIPYKDDYLIFGCASTMWFLAGDPMFGGSINELDLTVGIFGSQSWCFDGEGSMYFWGTNGIYVTQIPGVPKCITEINLPNLVNDEGADPSTHKITMVYDRKRKGVLTCITKLSDGTNSNYWYDLRTGGFFPESYPDECGAYAVFDYPANSNTYKDLLLGCKDGYIRKFDSSAKDDDKGASDQAINSYVKFGPIPMSQDPDKKGKLSGLNLTTAGGGTSGSQSDSSNVNFKIFVENSAEKVIEKLSANTNPNLAGTFKAPGRQPGAKRKQKVKGAYLGIRLDNTTTSETWGFEKLTGTITPAGKVK